MANILRKVSPCGLLARKPALVPCIAVLFWIFFPSAHGANGTWSNTGGGSWASAANWSGGIIANGSASIANFGTVSLAADSVLTLDGARTIGSLVFDDQNVTKHNWFLNAGSGARRRHDWVHD